MELAKNLIQGYDTPSTQAKAEMKEFMEDQFPHLTARIILNVADSDMVVSLVEYRSSHVKYGREAV